MKRRMIPIFLMLLAGAITSIITYIRDYELVKMLWTLLGVLIVFYALGVVIKKTLNLFDAQIEEAEKKAKEAEGPVGEEETEEGDKQNTENPSED